MFYPEQLVTVPEAEVIIGRQDKSKSVPFAAGIASCLHLI
jgi:hypothetical protein